MTWDEFINLKVNSERTGQVETDIVCPKCGRNVYLDTTIILTTYPEKHKYWCSCGWWGASPVKWGEQR